MFYSIPDNCQCASELIMDMSKMILRQTTKTEKTSKLLLQWDQITVIETQITSVSTVCSGVFTFNNKAFPFERKHQRSASLGLYEGNPSFTSGYPSERASNTESISISWHRHDVITWCQNSWDITVITSISTGLRVPPVSGIQRNYL